MALSHIEENTDKLIAALNFYKELLETKAASPAELENAQLKAQSIKEEILKLTLRNKKLLSVLEERHRPGGRHG